MALHVKEPAAPPSPPAETAPAESIDAWAKRLAGDLVDASESEYGPRAPAPDPPGWEEIERLVDALVSAAIAGVHDGNWYGTGEEARAARAALLRALRASVSGAVGSPPGSPTHEPSRRCPQPILHRDGLWPLGCHCQCEHPRCREAYATPASPSGPGSAAGGDAGEAGERCEACERRYPEVWRAPDVLWANVTGRDDGGGLLCMPCFAARALKEGGVAIYWECRADEYPTAPAPSPAGEAPRSDDGAGEGTKTP